MSKIKFGYGQYPINFLADSNYDETSNPAIFIVPLVGLTSQVRLLKVVLLPAPLTPNKAKHSPLCKANDRSLTATRGADGLQHPFCSILYTFLKFFT